MGSPCPLEPWTWQIRVAAIVIAVLAVVASQVGVKEAFVDVVVVVVLVGSEVEVGEWGKIASVDIAASETAAGVPMDSC